MQKLELRVNCHYEGADVGMVACVQEISRIDCMFSQQNMALCQDEQSYCTLLIHCQNVVSWPQKRDLRQKTTKVNQVVRVQGAKQIIKTGLYFKSHLTDAAVKQKLCSL